MKLMVCRLYMIFSKLTIGLSNLFFHNLGDCPLWMAVQHKVKWLAQKTSEQTIDACLLTSSVAFQIKRRKILKSMKFQGLQKSNGKLGGFLKNVYTYFLTKTEKICLVCWLTETIDNSLSEAGRKNNSYRIFPFVSKDF